MVAKLVTYQSYCYYHYRYTDILVINISTIIIPFFVCISHELGVVTERELSSPAEISTSVMFACDVINVLIFIINGVSGPRLLASTNPSFNLVEGDYTTLIKSFHQFLSSPQGGRRRRYCAKTRARKQKASGRREKCLFIGLSAWLSEGGGEGAKESGII